MNPVRFITARGVRYVLIGVSGANLYAPDGQSMFVTKDYGFFLPLHAANLVQAWAACETAGLDKDELFLATHKDALEQLFGKGDD